MISKIIVIVQKERNGCMVHGEIFLQKWLALFQGHKV